MTQLHANEAHRDDDQRRQHRQYPSGQARSVSVVVPTVVVVVVLLGRDGGVITHGISSVFGEVAAIRNRTTRQHPPFTTCRDSGKTFAVMTCDDMNGLAVSMK
jgi:hypothetical protein